MDTSSLHRATSSTPRHAASSFTAARGTRPDYSHPRSLIPEYLWRLFHKDQMDLESTFSQMANLCLHRPKAVYKTTQVRKQIKNQWARDDPAFVAIQIALMIVATFAFSITFGVFSLSHWLRIVLGSVLIEFVAAGCVIATAFRYVANKYLKTQRLLNTEQEVEWLYAFDVHCNAFFPFFLLLYVVQFFLAPLLIQETAFAALLANCLYAFAFSYYFYVSFLGYAVLPFLQNTQKLLYPIGLVAIAFVFSLLLQINLTRVVLNYYFGQ